MGKILPTPCTRIKRQQITFAINSWFGKWPYEVTNKVIPGRKKKKSRCERKMVLREIKNLISQNYTLKKKVNK